MEAPFYCPNFLLWLERFQGTWSDGSVEFSIRRRDDGCLEARDDSGQLVTLSAVLGRCEKTTEPPGPLGDRPVILSSSLMGLWLTEPEVKRFQYAWAASSGMRLMLEAVERAILKCEPLDREMKWWTWWRHHALKNKSPLPTEDFQEHVQLFDEFRGSIE